MVNFTILQVVLLTLLAFIKHVDYYGIPMIFVNYAVFWGLITGVVMGDWKTGLVIGGTIQLMQLGVAGFGGSSIPDYGTMAIIATAYGVTWAPTRASPSACRSACSASSSTSSPRSSTALSSRSPRSSATRVSSIR